MRIDVKYYNQCNWKLKPNIRFDFNYSFSSVFDKYKFINIYYTSFIYSSIFIIKNNYGSLKHKQFYLICG